MYGGKPLKENLPEAVPYQTRDAVGAELGMSGRTNDDKRHAVMVLLQDDEWGRWSDREIADKCGVSHPFVINLRKSLVTVTSERTYVNRYGTVATMNTERIAARAKENQGARTDISQNSVKSVDTQKELARNR